MFVDVCTFHHPATTKPPTSHWCKRGGGRKKYQFQKKKKKKNHTSLWWEPSGSMPSQFPVDKLKKKTRNLQKGEVISGTRTHSRHAAGLTSSEHTDTLFSNCHIAVAVPSIIEMSGVQQFTHFQLNISVHNTLVTKTKPDASLWLSPTFT